MNRVVLVTAALVGLSACNEPMRPDAAPRRPSRPALLGAASVGSTTMLGTLGGNESRAFGINNSGVIVGTSTNAAGGTEAFRYTSGGGMVSLYGSPSTAQGINDAGDIVGSKTENGAQYMMVWSAGSLYGVSYDGLEGANGSAFGVDINNLGNFTGTSTVNGRTANHAFYYRPGTGIDDIGTLGGTSSFGQAVNDQGYVVGFSNIANGHTHAFVWSLATGIQDIGTLPGGSDSFAFDVNNSGQVVGYSFLPNGEAHAFIYDIPSGVMQDIGTMTPGGSTVGFGIDASGRVIGYATVASGQFHAFAWSPASGFIDLGPTPGGTFSFGRRMNDNGVAVGFGTAADGFTKGLVWTVDFGGTPSNVAPAAMVAGPSSATEGQTLTFSASGSSDSDGSIVSYEWDLDNDGAYDDATGATASYTFPDNGTYTVGVRVTDDDGAASTASTTVVVSNVAPSVNAGQDRLIFTNNQLFVSGHFADAGLADGPWSYSIDWADGSPVTTGSTTSQSATISASHAYATNGNYNVTLTVTDKDGGSATDNVALAVVAVPPKTASIPMDIFPNAANTYSVSSGALVPVALMGTAPNPVSGLNLSTVYLSHPVWGSIYPATTCPSSCVTYSDVNGDGLQDVTIMFDFSGVVPTVQNLPTTQPFALYVKRTNGLQMKSANQFISLQP